MKKPVLLSLLLATLNASAQTTLLEESFDTYAEGSGMVDNDPTHWALWPGGEDQVVSTAFAQSGTNSMACVSTSAANGGPGDLLLLLGDRTTGVYDLGWSMLVPSDKGGYFNLQHAEDVGASGSFGLEVVFVDGTITATAAGVDQTGTYVAGEWMDILINVDVDNSGAALFVNGTPITTWPLEMDTEGGDVAPQLGAIDFYSYGDGTVIGEYYVDDISYVQTSAGGIGMGEFGASSVRVFPNPADDAVSVILPRVLGPQAVVQVVDAAGQVVARPSLLSARGLRIPMQGVASGVYMLLIQDGEQRWMERVVKR
jgi:Secretion system C-terminal sorting domain